MTHATETPDELNAALQRLLTYTAKLNLGSKEGGPDAVVDNIIEGIADLERRLAAAEAERDDYYAEIKETVQILGKALTGEDGMHIGHVSEMAKELVAAESALRSAGERVREQFEQYAAAQGYKDFEQNEFDDYRNPNVNGLWTFWQAAIRALPVQGEVNAGPQYKPHVVGGKIVGQDFVNHDQIDTSAPTEPPAGIAIPHSGLTDDWLRDFWRSNGGAFHGPHVETGIMPEEKLLPMLRALVAGKIAADIHQAAAAAKVGEAE